MENMGDMEEMEDREEYQSFPQTIVTFPQKEYIIEADPEPDLQIIPKQQTISFPTLPHPTTLYRKFVQKYGLTPGTKVSPTTEDISLLQRYLKHSEFQNNNFILQWEKIFKNNVIPGIAYASETTNTHDNATQNIIQAAISSQIPDFTSNSLLGGAKAANTTATNTGRSKRSKTSK